MEALVLYWKNMTEHIFLAESTYILYLNVLFSEVEFYFTIQ